MPLLTVNKQRIDKYYIKNTSTDLKDGVIAKEVIIAPRKFPKGWNCAVFPFDVTIEEMKENFGDDVKIWTYDAIEWETAIQGLDGPTWHYENNKIYSISRSAEVGSKQYTNYTAYLNPDLAQPKLIRNNIPFIFRTTAAHNATDANPLVFKNKEIILPKQPQNLWKMNIGNMYMVSNMSYINTLVTDAMGLRKWMPVLDSNKKQYIVMLHASQGTINFTDAGTNIFPLQCTGCFMACLKKDSPLC